MPDYLATFRMTGATCPNKKSITANSVSAAIEAMLASVNQLSTMNVDEFEILQILGGGQYAVVATKNKKETRVVQPPYDANVSGTAKEVANGSM